MLSEVLGLITMIFIFWNLLFLNQPPARHRISFPYSILSTLLELTDEFSAFSKSLEIESDQFFRNTFLMIPFHKATGASSSPESAPMTTILSVRAFPRWRKPFNRDDMNLLCRLLESFQDNLFLRVFDLTGADDHRIEATIIDHDRPLRD